VGGRGKDEVREGGKRGVAGEKGEDIWGGGNGGSQGSGRREEGVGGRENEVGWRGGGRN